MSDLTLAYYMLNMVNRWYHTLGRKNHYRKNTPIEAYVNGKWITGFIVKKLSLIDDWWYPYYTYAILLDDVYIAEVILAEMFIRERSDDSGIRASQDSGTD